jgi:hypothetical protein
MKKIAEVSIEFVIKFLIWLVVAVLLGAGVYLLIKKLGIN